LLTIVRRAPANLDKPTEIVRGQASRLPWAWAGLCVGVALQEASNEGFRDIVNNIPSSTISLMGWVKDNRGNPSTSGTASNGSYVGWPDSPIHDSPKTAITAYVRTKPIALTEIDGGAWYMPYDSGPNYSSWGIQTGNPDPNTMYGSMSFGGGIEYATPATATVPSTEWCSVFLRWQSGDVLSMDVLGERGNTISSVTRSGSLSGSIGYASGLGLRMNTTFATTNNAGYAYSQGMVWNRRLTNTEMTALVSDPYGWYSPRRETVGTSSPYPLIAGAGEIRFGTGGGGLI
jgi:hypothetical protein